MRIALFLPCLQNGGVERVMLNLAQGLAARHLSVDLVLAKAEGSYLSEVPAAVRVVDLRSSRVLASLPGLVRYLRQARPRVLISAKDYVNVVAIWARRIAGVRTRTVVTVHGDPNMRVQNARRRRDRMLPLLMRVLYPKADAVVAVSQGVAQGLVGLIGLPRDSVHVIYNPVVTPEIFTKAEEPVEHPWFAPGEPPVVLGVGRLSPEKDFASLIRAVALVYKERPVRLMIVGEGAERTRLEQIVQGLGLKDVVSLPGFVKNPFKYMKSADVFVLSSRWEALPTVLIEAMALGVPVISTDCPSGPAEILENGKWGDLVPIGDVEGLASAILRRLKNPDDTKIKGAAERARVFSLDRVVNQYLDLVLGGVSDESIGPDRVT